jgi:hypothetical protein
MSPLASLLFTQTKTHQIIAKDRSRARFCLVFQLRFYANHHKPGLTKFAIRLDECTLDRLAIYELRNAPSVNILETPTISPRRYVKINSSDLSHNRHLQSSTTKPYRNPHGHWLVLMTRRGPRYEKNKFEGFKSGTTNKCHFTGSQEDPMPVPSYVLAADQVVRKTRPTLDGSIIVRRIVMMVKLASCPALAILCLSDKALYYGVAHKRGR